MLILGIDPGTALTGYAFVEVRENKKPYLLEKEAGVGVVKTPSTMDMHDRLNLLFKEMSNICKWFSPDVMVVEKLFFNTNVKTAITVGQARGIPLLVASRKKIKVAEYTALQAKKAVSGSGRANKKEMQHAVKEYMGLMDIIKPDDANDAVAMALCYYLHEMEVGG
jgi:crossover junction endodeoxyribonuclease RuvC